MKFNDCDMPEIKQYFPNFQLIDGTIQGEIAFSAIYVKNKRGQWVIESCNDTHKEKYVAGSYQIKIILNQKEIPSVYETSGKIIVVANRLKMPIHGLHINNDGSCRLDFAIHPELAIKEFILNKVYPFFGWQASIMRNLNRHRHQVSILMVSKQNNSSFMMLKK